MSTSRALWRTWLERFSEARSERMKITLKAEIRRLTQREYIEQFGITEGDAGENEPRFRAVVEAIERKDVFVLKHGGEWLGATYPDEWYGPMPLDEAQSLCASINDTPNFAAQAEQTRAYQRLARTIRKTRTPEYRAALKKQTEALAGFEPTPYPSIRLKPPSPDDSWIVQMSARPEPFTQDEIAEYQRIDRARKVRHMQAKRNRAKQPAATAAKTQKAAQRAAMARQMRARGVTNGEIATALGITVRQVQRLLRK